MKTEKKKTLCGSALFTVVAVMAILILFLTGTLALATASNSRAHKSYAVSQASYTARAAIRAFKEGMTQDADLAAAVGALGESGGNIPLKVKVTMDDKSMGIIGHWDEDNPNEWVDNEIVLEPVPDKVDWVYDVDKNEWVSWNIVKLTSTCRVGQEEETVIAYISKHGEPGETQQTNNEVKGLQEAGGNNYVNGADIYGGLGIGLADDHPGSYGGTNAFRTHTSLTFINGDFDFKTSSTEFNVDDNESGVTPVAAYVIMGNCSSSNNTAIKVNYTLKKDFTQKDIPYFYVDRLLYQRDQTDFTFSTGNGAPFNIFAGTIYHPYNFKADADLYLMDEVATDDTPETLRDYYSEGYDLAPDGFPKLKGYWPDKQYWNDPSLVEEKEKAMQDPANIIGGETKIEVGKNVIGTDTKSADGKQLYKWTLGTFKRLDDTKIDSIGGTIYCNGDLNLYFAKIHGDVRVKGKCVISGKDTVIDGDLVVENAYENANKSDAEKVSGLTFTDGASAEQIHGRIYVSQGTATDTSTLKEGYSKKTGVYPDYKVYENKSLPNVEIVESSYEINSDGKYVYGGVEYDSKPYIQCKPLTDNEAGITIGATVPEIITTSENTRFKTFSDGRILDDAGYFEVTTEKESYYTKDGVEVGKSEAMGEYYADPEGNRVQRADAYNISFSGSGSVNVNSYPKGSAYPEDMTREKIYGTKNKNADSSTKLITTLIDARKALGMNPDDGYFDEKIYIREKPSNPVAVIDSTYLEEHKVTKDGQNQIELVRPKENADWYILDGVDLSGYEISIVDNTSAIKSPNSHVKYQGGIIRFFIQGDVKLNNSSIAPSKILDKTMNEIHYKDDFGIEYFTGGAYRTNDDASDPKKETGKDTEGTLTCINNCLIVGSLKAPYLDIAFANGQGRYSFVYTTESGEQKGKNEDYKPCIIGNALVRRVTDAQNGLNLAYTKSGASSNSNSNDEIAVDPSGTEWKFKYYTR